MVLLVNGDYVLFPEMMTSEISKTLWGLWVALKRDCGNFYACSFISEIADLFWLTLTLFWIFSFPVILSCASCFF